MKPIARKDMKVPKTFPCPHCRRLVQACAPFRALLYLTCYGIPTIVAYQLVRPFWLGLIVWFFLCVLFAFLYSFIALFFWTPRLKLYEKGDGGFCSLDLNK